MSNPSTPGTTIYFDTSFFVWLANAAPSVGERVIDAINRYGIRYVVSFSHVCELGQCVNNPDGDARLVERLARIARPPLLLDECDLAVLSVTGEARIALANQLAKSLPRITRARAYAALAYRWQTEPPRADRAREMAVLRAIGAVREDGTPATAEEILAYPPIAEALARFGIPAEDLNSPAAAEAWHQKLMEQITSNAPPGFVERLQIEQSVGASALRTDNRIFDAILSPEKEDGFRKLGNTMRDVEHMAWFLQNESEIELLQLDGPQLQLVEAHPEHPLASMTSAGRVFTARNLDEVVAVIERAARCAA